MILILSLLIIIYICNVVAQAGEGTGSSGCWLMFLTTNQFDGDLGGIEGADLKCIMCIY
jgi:hypothetical protein